MLMREFSPAGVASRPPAARLRARAASHPRGHSFTGCCPQAALDAPRSRDSMSFSHLPGVLEHLTLFPPKTDRAVLPLSRPARCGPGGRAPPPAALGLCRFLRRMGTRPGLSRASGGVQGDAESFHAPSSRCKRVRSVPFPGGGVFRAFLPPPLAPFLDTVVKFLSNSPE